VYVDEGGCYDDARAEIFCYEEGPFWHSYTFVTSSVDGKSSACVKMSIEAARGNLRSGLTERRAHKDHEDG